MRKPAESCVPFCLGRLCLFTAVTMSAHNHHVIVDKKVAVVIVLMLAADVDNPAVGRSVSVLPTRMKQKIGLRSNFTSRYLRTWKA